MSLPGKPDWRNNECPCFEGSAEDVCTRTELSEPVQSEYSYQLAVNSFVTLNIYDILGREITTLVNKTMTTGTYTVEWDGTNEPSGVYFYQLRIRNEELGIEYDQTRKMVLLK